MQGNSQADHVRELHVEKGVLDLPFTRRIIKRCPDLPINIVEDRNVPQVNWEEYPKSLTLGKRHLFLCRNRGVFFKPCPATREYRCCDYQVLNVGMNCPMDCVYCILQAYLNNPWLSFFVNIDDLEAELDAAFVDAPERFWRIGTGEFTDSLALDRLTHLSPILVDFMSRQSRGVLELKTKTAEIANLEGLCHKGKTVVAWSLNSSSVMRQEELRAASLEERLDAAVRCAEWGYRLAFHFDPLVHQPGWEQGYHETIEYLFSVVPKNRIVWISMGGLRFLPSLKSIAEARFPNSRIFLEEFVQGLDGKQRYFRDLRVAMYKFLAKEIQKRAAPETRLYLCMESDEIWREVFGFVPEEHGGLPAMLDRAICESG